MRKWLRFVRRSAAPKLPRQPQITCHTAFHGHADYGGWTICPDCLSSASIVYSFGVGEDASFDLDLIETYGVQVFAFDPTPKSIAWVESRDWPANFHFYPFGIADVDGTATFYPPENPEWVSHTILKRETAGHPIEVEMRRLTSIMNQLGHHQLDILKMDIEGAEYAVLDDILETRDLSITQILVEFHHRFPEVGLKHTADAIDTLNAHGYKIFSVSPSGEEYSFIK